MRHITFAQTSRQRIVAALAALSLGAALIGCGGGGNPGSPSSTPTSGSGYSLTAPASLPSQARITGAGTAT